MELVLAIVGPMLGGIISISVWQSKKTQECIQEIDKKLDTLSIELVKEYISRDELEERLENLQYKLKVELIDKNSGN